MTPKFRIFGLTFANEAVELFVWCRSEETGIMRAEMEARTRGLEFRRFWAEAV